MSLGAGSKSVAVELPTTPHSCARKAAKGRNGDGTGQVSGSGTADAAAELGPALVPSMCDYML